MLTLSPNLLIAFLGGVLPAFLWLTFWLLEDRCEPEPKRYIFFTFVLGGLAVIPAFYIEHPFMSTIYIWLVVGVAEESLKFAAAYLSSLRSWVFDEPLDAIIYMVTAALGFSAVENTLFLLQQPDVAHIVIAGDLRFIGATLLHTLASSSVGVALALGFYKSRTMRALYAVCGLILAITLHVLFDFFIISQGSGATLWIFFSVWIGIIAILLLTEQVKYPARDYC